MRRHGGSYSRRLNRAFFQRLVVGLLRPHFLDLGDVLRRLLRRDFQQHQQGVEALRQVVNAVTVDHPLRFKLRPILFEPALKFLDAAPKFGIIRRAPRQQ